MGSSASLSRQARVHVLTSAVPQGSPKCTELFRGRTGSSPFLSLYSEVKLPGFIGLIRLTLKFAGKKSALRFSFGVLLFSFFYVRHSPGQGRLLSPFP